MNRGLGSNGPLNIPPTGGLATYTPLFLNPLWVDVDIFISVNGPFFYLIYDLGLDSVNASSEAVARNLRMQGTWILTQQDVSGIPSNYIVSLNHGPVVAVDSRVQSYNVFTPGSNAPSGTTFLLKDVGRNASVNNITVRAPGEIGSNTGSSDGSTTFTDLGFDFQAAALAGSLYPGYMWLYIDTGPGAGQYLVTSVIDANNITVDNPIPSDDPITWNIGYSIDGAPFQVLNTDGQAVRFYFVPRYGWQII